jgi:hypothetical protein
LTHVVETTSLDSYHEALSAFVRWMDGVEQLLAAEKFAADEQDVMEASFNSVYGIKQNSDEFLLKCWDTIVFCSDNCEHFVS